MYVCVYTLRTVPFLSYISLVMKNQLFCYHQPGLCGSDGNLFGVHSTLQVCVCVSVCVCVCTSACVCVRASCVCVCVLIIKQDSTIYFLLP